jgi:hypothetical protein
MRDSSPSLFKAVCSNLNLLHGSIESSVNYSAINDRASGNTK